jgi:hypothetical protein
MRATITFLLILGLAGPAMANDKRSAPVTNFGMGAQSIPWANEPLSEQENQILFNKMMNGQLSPQELWLYEQRKRNMPQITDVEPVPHRYGEEDPAEVALRRRLMREGNKVR